MAVPKTNRDGVVIKKPGGEVLTTSRHSIFSGAPIATGGLTSPVKGHEGLYYRLTSAEARQLTAEQRAECCQKAVDIQKKYDGPRSSSSKPKSD